MNKPADIPEPTISTFGKTICSEARKYGFGQVDMLRLINVMMDNIGEFGAGQPNEVPPEFERGQFKVGSFPLESARLSIRKAGLEDRGLLQAWLDDKYGRHFLLSAMTARAMDLDRLLSHERHAVGIVMDKSGREIGAVAFLDIDAEQKRAELRKMIGVPEARGKGYAEEATRLWIEYGGKIIGLQKIFVTTLQTHLRNIQLNEAIGFKVEGVLHREVVIAGERHDVLRMGLCFDDL